MVHPVSRPQGLPMAAKQPMRVQTLGPNRRHDRASLHPNDEQTCIGPQVLVSLE
jgi:hypothetical protein